MKENNKDDDAVLRNDIRRHHEKNSEKTTLGLRNKERGGKQHEEINNMRIRK